MNIRTILFPTDFSESSEAALAYASALAADTGARLDIVHASDVTPVYYTAYGAYTHSPQETEKLVRQNRERLNRVQPTVEGVACRQENLTGEAGDEILKYANGEGVDLIVMGSHGRTGLLRLLMGSVAERVVRGAPCPVLIVKHPRADEAPGPSAGAEPHGVAT